MTGTKSLFRELDESHKLTVRLGDDKPMQVEGKGTVALETDCGKVKFLHDVFFVSSLSHNLLSVGQLMFSGYSILFDGDTCVIRDKKSGQVVVSMSMAKNKCSLLKSLVLIIMLLLLVRKVSLIYGT